VALETPVINTSLMKLALSPNPFSGSTELFLQLPKHSARITLAIYSLTGERVAALASNAMVAKGVHRFGWNGFNLQGKAVAAGCYVVRLQADDKTVHAKLVRMQ
jgi:flagellar hook assembly protein FlgD